MWWEVGKGGCRAVGETDFDGDPLKYYFMRVRDTGPKADFSSKYSNPFFIEM